MQIDVGLATEIHVAEIQHAGSLDCAYVDAASGIRVECLRTAVVGVGNRRIEHNLHRSTGGRERAEVRCERILFRRGVADALEGEVTPWCQASVLQLRKNVVFVLDEDAASELTEYKPL